MGVVMKKYNISYSEYLNKLSKEEISFYLNFFDLKYKTNNKKEILINILVNTSEQITKYAFNLFQNDENKTDTVLGILFSVVLMYKLAYIDDWQHNLFEFVFIQNIY